jgi:hypothetical protein
MYMGGGGWVSAFMYVVGGLGACVCARDAL